jgi:predicted  nucleic acid-binding Zn-ribbon protein
MLHFLYLKSIPVFKISGNQVLAFFLAIPTIRLYNHAMSQVLILYRLQKIDSQRDQIAARMAEIQLLLSNNQVLIDAKNNLTQAEQALLTVRRSLRLIEDTVQAKRIKLEQDESSLYGGRIRNPKELQDLQNEVASLKRRLAELEEEQFNAMISVEQAEAVHTAAAKQMQVAQSGFDQLKASLTGEQMALTRDINRLESERQATSVAVSPENQKLYERLRQQKRGLAVASLTDDACDSCGATLTPADKQSSRSPTQIFFCPSCGRILYAG